MLQGRSQISQTAGAATDRGEIGRVRPEDGAQVVGPGRRTTLMMQGAYQAGCGVMAVPTAQTPRQFSIGLQVNKIHNNISLNRPRLSVITKKYLTA